MADFTLTLGSFTFQDFEIPNSIALGGSQMLDIKKYPGGLRTGDAFGPDNKPISWSGMMFGIGGETAEQRAQELDALRVAGQPLTLSISSFNYQVLISKFEFEFEKYYQIPYRIELEVLADNTQPVTDDGEDTESDMQSDLDDASGFETALGENGFSTDMGTIFDDIAVMPSISGGTVSQLTQLSADVAIAQEEAASLAAASDTEMNTVGLSVNFASGVSPIAMVANLQAMSDSSFELSNAFCAANTLSKLGKSISSVLTGG